MISEMQKNTPLVSLITPGWNGKHFVHRLLDSILMQTYKNIEYIYVDDGSTDGSREIVLSYQEKFKERGIDFQYIWKENGGVSTAIEEGLKHVKGEFLCWPEYDDYLTPNSIEVKVNYLLSHPDCACVTSDAWLVSEEEPTKPYGVLSNYNVNRFDRNHFVQALLSNSVFTEWISLIKRILIGKFIILQLAPIGKFYFLYIISITEGLSPHPCVIICNE